MERTIVKRSVFIAVLAVLLCALSAYSAHAAVSVLNGSTWNSSNNTADNLKVTLSKDKKTITLEFKHSDNFDGLDYRLVPYSGKTNLNGKNPWLVFSKGKEDGKKGTLKKSYKYPDINGKFVNRDKKNLYYLFVYGNKSEDYKPVVRGPLWI